MIIIYYDSHTRRLCHNKRYIFCTIRFMHAEFREFRSYRRFLWSRTLYTTLT